MEKLNDLEKKLFYELLKNDKKIKYFQAIRSIIDEERNGEEIVFLSDYQKKVYNDARTLELIKPFQQNYISDFEDLSQEDLDKLTDEEINKKIESRKNQQNFKDNIMLKYIETVKRIKEYTDNKNEEEIKKLLEKDKEKVLNEIEKIKTNFKADEIEYKKKYINNKLEMFKNRKKSLLEAKTITINGETYSTKGLNKSEKIILSDVFSIMKQALIDREKEIKTGKEKLKIISTTYKPLFDGDYKLKDLDKNRKHIIEKFYEENKKIYEKIPQVHKNDLKQFLINKKTNNEKVYNSDIDLVIGITKNSNGEIIKYKGTKEEVLNILSNKENDLIDLTSNNTIDMVSVRNVATGKSEINTKELLNNIEQSPLIIPLFKDDLFKDKYPYSELDYKDFFSLISEFEIEELENPDLLRNVPDERKKEHKKQIEEMNENLLKTLKETDDLSKMEIILKEDENKKTFLDYKNKNPEYTNAVFDNSKSRNFNKLRKEINESLSEIESNENSDIYKNLKKYNTAIEAYNNLLNKDTKDDNFLDRLKNSQIQNLLETLKDKDDEKFKEHFLRLLDNKDLENTLKQAQENFYLQLRDVKRNELNLLQTAIKPSNINQKIKEDPIMTFIFPINLIPALFKDIMEYYISYSEYDYSLKQLQNKKKEHKEILIDKMTTSLKELGFSSTAINAIKIDLEDEKGKLDLKISPNRLFKDYFMNLLKEKTDTINEETKLKDIQLESQINILNEAMEKSKNKSKEDIDTLLKNNFNFDTDIDSELKEKFLKELYNTLKETTLYKEGPNSYLINLRNKIKKQNNKDLTKAYSFLFPEIFNDNFYIDKLNKKLNKEELKILKDILSENDVYFNKEDFIKKLKNKSKKYIDFFNENQKKIEKLKKEIEEPGLEIEEIISIEEKIKEIEKENKKYLFLNNIEEKLLDIPENDKELYYQNFINELKIKLLENINNSTNNGNENNNKINKLLENTKIDYDKPLNIYYGKLLENIYLNENLSDIEKENLAKYINQLEEKTGLNDLYNKDFNKKIEKMNLNLNPVFKMEKEFIDIKKEYEKARKKTILSIKLQNSKKKKEIKKKTKYKKKEDFNIDM